MPRSSFQMIYFGKTHFGAIPSICNQRSLAYWSLLNESSSPFFILIHWKAFLSSFEKFTDRELLLPVEVPWTIEPNNFWCRTCELVNNKVAAISQDIHSMLDWMKKMSNMSWIHWVSTSDWNFSRFFLSHNFENWLIFISLEIKNSRSFISKNRRKSLDDRFGLLYSLRFLEGKLFRLTGNKV